MARDMENIVIENARLIFRNFTGEASKFNRDGCRNFCVVIEDPEDAENLRSLGWNVRERPPREEGDDVLYYLQVTVGFGAYPPAVWLISGHRKTQLTEANIATLDFIDIKTADVVIRPYCWDVNGKSGVKAYLKAAYITQDSDGFAEKYADLEMSESTPW